MADINISGSNMLNSACILSFYIHHTACTSNLYKPLIAYITVILHLDGMEKVHLE